MSRAIARALGVALGVSLAAVSLLAACSSTTSGRGTATAAATSRPGDATPTDTISAVAGTPTITPTTTGPGNSHPPTPSRTSLGSVTAPVGFVGAWDGHGRHLTVSVGGAVVVDFRTYVDCTTTVTTGCDQIIGNVIHDGGHVTGRITRVISPTTVIVTIASTTDPAAIPAGPVRLGHDLGHHAVALFAGQYSGVPFCGAAAPAGYCGA